MDHLEVLREKVASLRVEIVQLQELNEQYRRQARPDAQAHLLTARGMSGCKKSSKNSPKSRVLVDDSGQSEGNA